jgi:hypothetical protein
MTDHSDLNTLRLLTSECGSGSCPTVYVEHDGSLVVQGYTTTYTTPAGEDAVRIPRSVLLEAARNLLD